MNTESLPAKVRRLRADVAANPEMYDGDADVVYWLVDDAVSRSWTPSEIGRALGITSHAARSILERLARDQLIASTERGAWTRYGSRRS